MSAVEDRLTDALAARASLERVDAAVLARHRADVRAAVEDGVVSLDAHCSPAAERDDDALAAVVASAPDGGPAHLRWDRRRTVRVLAAAAAVLLVATAGVVALRSWERAAHPAAQTASAYAGLARPQVRADVPEGPTFGDEVDPRSVRLLARAGDTAFSAGISVDGRLCTGSASASQSAIAISCETLPGAAQAVELPGPSSPSPVWLVPDGWNTTDLAAQGLVEVAPSVWAPASAAADFSGPDSWWALGGYRALGRPAAAGDALPGNGSGLDALLVPSSSRLLVQTPAATYYAATTQDGRVCFVQAYRDDGTAATCATAEDVTSGTWVGATVQGQEARLVTDSAQELDEDGYGRLVPLDGNVWVDEQTAAEAAPTQVVTATDDTAVRGPSVLTGAQQLVPLTEPGTYAVLLRCLDVSPVVVTVDGAPSGPEPGCTGRTFPVVGAAAWVDVAGAPVTVALEAGDDAEYAVAVVRCSPMSRQCPSTPAG